MHVFRFALFAAILGLAFSSRLPAQGIEIVKRDSVKVPNGTKAGIFKDVKTTVRTSPEFLKNIFVTQVNRRRIATEMDVKNALGKSDMIAPGITLLDMVFHLGQPSFRLTSANSFEGKLSRNHLYFRSTTPTPLGSWADPRIEVNFDLLVAGQFTLPTTTNPRFQVQNAALSVPWAEVPPRNWSSGVLTTIAAITNYFAKAATGKDLLQQVANNYLRRDMTDYFNSRLETFNTVIKEVQAQGYGNIESRFDAGRNMIVVELSQANKLALRPVGKAKTSSDGLVQPRANGPLQKIEDMKPIPAVPKTIPLPKGIGAVQAPAMNRNLVIR